LGREDFLENIRILLSSDVRRFVDNRVESFRSIDRYSPRIVMRELAYCILTANYRADKVLEIERVLGDRYIDISYEELRNALKEMGYRYPNVRSRYIVLARGVLAEVISVINSGLESSLTRSRLVKLVKGFGMKEASHFLRNIGFLDLAIIDRHIIKILRYYGLVGEVASLTPSRYLELEGLIKDLSGELGIEPGVLDLYMWYMSTGKVLK